MTRDPTAAARARKAEAKADGVISIQLGAGGSGGGGGGGGGGEKPVGGGGFKKGGFKKSGFKSAFAPAGGEDGEKDGSSKAREDAAEEGKVKSLGLQRAGNHDMESDTEDEGYEMYDPRFPTD